MKSKDFIEICRQSLYAIRGDKDLDILFTLYEEGELTLEQLNIRFNPVIDYILNLQKSGLVKRGISPNDDVYSLIPWGKDFIKKIIQIYEELWMVKE